MTMLTPPVVAFIGLGGNVGDAASTLRSAIEQLQALPGTRVLSTSRLYRTAPVGGIEQADFINAVAQLETTLPADELLQALFAIERAHGRDRSIEQRWGPRTLDLDLLLCGTEVIDIDGLTVPHPRIAERAFVLVPLVEIAPHAVIPGHGAAKDVLTALETFTCEALG